MSKSLHIQITTNNEELFKLYNELLSNDDVDEEKVLILMCYPYTNKDFLTEEEIIDTIAVIRFKLVLYQWGIKY